MAGQMGMGGGTSGYPTGAPSLNVPGLLNPNNPPTGTTSSTFYPNTSHSHVHARMRANTINHTDVIPPALARLQHMNQDVIAGRNALTPVLNRDDAMREWERRQSGKPAAAQPYPQLEYLQQQAELAAAGGLGAWSAGSGGGPGPGPGAGGGGTGGSGGTGGGAARYQAPPSKLSHSYQPTIIVDDESRREAVMSNVRSAARGDAGPSTGYNPSAMVTSPAQTYATGLAASGATTGGGSGGPGTGGGGGTRYQASFAQQQASNSPFDAIGQRTDIGTLYVPLQPDQYQSYAGPTGSGGSVGVGSVRTQGVNAPPATQGGAPSFYGPSVAGAQGRNPFSGGGSGGEGGGGGGQGGQGQGGMSTKDARRMSGMDIWSR